MAHWNFQTRRGWAFSRFSQDDVVERSTVMNLILSLSWVFEILAQDAIEHFEFIRQNMMNHFNYFLHGAVNHTFFHPQHAVEHSKFLHKTWLFTLMNLSFKLSWASGIEHLEFSKKTQFNISQITYKTRLSVSINFVFTRLVWAFKIFSQDAVNIFEVFPQDVVVGFD